jgi:hypothetical protein
MKQNAAHELASPILYSASDSKACISPLISALREALAADTYWCSLLARLADQSPCGLHVGVFIEPYLQLLLEGKKTLESRFSINRTAPYQKVADGDLLLLKRSGGPIVGICQIMHAWSYELDAAAWNTLKTQHARALCIQSPAFWEQKRHANYATLMQVRHPRALESAIAFVKSDRRGWLTL